LREVEKKVGDNSGRTSYTDYSAQHEVDAMKKQRGDMPTSQNTTYPEGIEMKVARIRAGLRQYEVATSVGILANRLSEIEAGRRRPSPELLERILQVIKGNHDGQTERKS
jgi:DNA-binding transcriptional regulator YiaG